MRPMKASQVYLFITTNLIENSYVLETLHEHSSVVPRAFMGIPLYIVTVYLSGTEEPSSWLGALSVKFLKFQVSRPA